jgi:hypothetical protein
VSAEPFLRCVFSLLGYKPHLVQWEVHLSKARFRVLACGARFGKTTLAAYETLSALLLPSRDGEPCSRGWIVAGTYELAGRAFRQVISAARVHFPSRIIKASDSEMLLRLRNTGDGESEVRAKSAERPDGLLGEGLDFLVVDEAALLRERIWTDYLSPRLVDRKGWALFCSTPKGKNWFHRLHLRGHDPSFPDWECWNAPTSANPHVAESEIEREKRSLPSAAFSQEYLARFVDEASSVFRGIENCLSDAPESEGEHRYVIGCDLARHVDFTAVAVLNEEGALVHLDRWRGVAYPEQREKVARLADSFGQARVIFDATGVGEPVSEDLRRMGVRVLPVKFTSDRKRDLIESLALAIELGELRLPARRDLLEELEAFSFSRTASGTPVYGAPPGLHDDMLIALALAVWGWRGRRFPTPAADRPAGF